MRTQVDFDYTISDERLINWSRRPVVERLHMLDNLRRFTLVVRQAATVVKCDAEIGQPARGSSAHSP